MTLVPSLRPWRGSRTALVAIPAWLLAVAGGMVLLWRYAGTPGLAASAPARWPAASRLVRAADRPTAVLFAHPQCPCTEATLSALAQALARTGGGLTATVVFSTPPETGWSWGDTALMASARRLPGVAVVRDPGGREAALFGAATSGQAYVFDARGRLAFQGGLTPARGHGGPAAGLDALVALGRGGVPALTATRVFGCALFTPSTP